MQRQKAITSSRTILIIERPVPIFDLTDLSLQDELCICENKYAFIFGGVRQFLKKFRFLTNKQTKNIGQCVLCWDRSRFERRIIFVILKAKRETEVEFKWRNKKND